MVTLLFILWTLISTLLTINVFTPLGKRPKSSFYFLLFSFASGWLIGDMLPLWLILQWGMLGLFALSDILTQPVGWTALLVLGAGWVLLAIRQCLILDYPIRLHQKMTDQLGAFWTEKSIPFHYPTSLKNVDWSIWLNPNALFNQNVEIERDQIFFAENDVRLTLDVYLPKKQLYNKRPVLLQIHGGAWITGSKRQAALLMNRMASAGWVCFSVAYRFSPEVTFPEHLIDVKRALSWIRKNSDRYTLDTDFIITTGGSAGGHLASLMALTPNVPEFQPGFEDEKTDIQGCVSMFGVFDFSKHFSESQNPETCYPAKEQLLEMVCGGNPESKPLEFQQITPENWISEHNPPFLLVQGEIDALIPIEETREFYQQLIRKGASETAILNLPLVEHAFDIFPTMTAQCTVPIVERYLKCLHHQYIQNEEICI